MTVENYDWFLLLPETTYVNPFELMRFINRISWNKLVAISGYLSGNGNNDDHGCVLESGILLSYPAMKTILE